MTAAKLRDRPSPPLRAPYVQARALSACELVWAAGGFVRRKIVLKRCCLAAGRSGGGREVEKGRCTREGGSGGEGWRETSETSHTPPRAPASARPSAALHPPRPALGIEPRPWAWQLARPPTTRHSSCPPFIWALARGPCISRILELWPLQISDHGQLSQLDATQRHDTPAQPHPGNVVLSAFEGLEAGAVVLVFSISGLRDAPRRIAPAPLSPPAPLQPSRRRGRPVPPLLAQPQLHSVRTTARSEPISDRYTDPSRTDPHLCHMPPSPTSSWILTATAADLTRGHSAGLERGDVMGPNFSAGQVREGRWRPSRTARAMEATSLALRRTFNGPRNRL